MYNLVKRQAEVEILPMALEMGLGVCSYSPLAGGLLTGKYQSEGAQGRLVANAMYKVRYGEAANNDIAVGLQALAREVGHHPASVAVAWVASHPGITAPILGARNLEQLEPSLKALDVGMTPELRERISKLSPAPPPAHDRSEEKR
jgi:aryl-alcohol dehydrogenase-like predicted oxidoreductase